jgi:type IV secretory pathway VirB3-like protein
MKKYEPYKNIRKKAIIFGLPLPLFALMMICIIASLFVIIFSFSLPVIIGALLFNAILYILLNRINRLLELFQMLGIFPQMISNKRNSNIRYEKN